MSSHKVLKSLSLLAALATIMVASALVAQDRPPSRFDLFTGYSWLHPGYDTLVPNAQENISRGFTVSGTYFFNRHIGVGIDDGNHYGCCCPKIFTLQAGPTLRFPGEHVTPFLHALVGLHRMDLLAPIGDNNTWGVIAGGGLDIALARHVSIRLFQVDYEYADHDYTVLQSKLNGVRVSAGLVWQFGSIGAERVAVNATCTVQPTEGFAGEPLTATATGSNFNPKHTIVYSWSGRGVNGTTKEATARVDTTGLAPGTYPVRADLNDGSKRGVTSCTASFTVKELPVAAPPQHPPTIACSANPGTVKPGEPSAITADGHSPDSRPLTYSYTASVGRITPNGARATLDTTGASAGPISISCTATDDRGLSANAPTTVNVEAPVIAPMASKCGSIDFTRDKRRPSRVDNQAKAILDECALRLQREPSASGVIVGNSDPIEKNPLRVSQQRAVNTKAYLVGDKGIDPARLEVRTGNGGMQTADIWVVPVGATFNGEGTATFDEKKVKE